MKRLILIAMLCYFSLAACKKDDTHPRHRAIDPVQSVHAFAGKGRIKLIWKLPVDKIISECRIYWNNGKDSITVNIPTTTAKDSIIINNLQEGTYIFYFVLFDKKGNESEKAFVRGMAYGKKYADSLKNRFIQKEEYNIANGEVDITWGDAGVGVVGTEMNYVDSAGIARNIFIPVYFTKTTLKDFSTLKDSIIRYRTIFLPELTAIDSFYTRYDTILFHSNAYVEPIVLWNGDPSKGGNSIWRVLNIDGGGNITVVDDSVWKFYKPAGSHRTEGHGVKGFQAQEGDIIYIGWKYKLDMPQKTTTNAIFQWKAYGANMKQNYPVVLKPVNGTLKLMYHNPDYQPEYIWTTPTVVDKWISIVLKLKVSRDASKGYIEFWYNGEQQILSNGLIRYPARTLDAEHCDPKWGVYGADGAIVTNYVTDLKIATAYELVKPE